MALPGLFPIYPDPIPLKYQVSLALPPLPISKISQEIGITASTSFLVPNVDFLQKFISGDIGISDKILKESMYKTLNSPIAQRDENVFKKFAEISNTNIPDVNKLKTEGKIKLPKDQFSLPPTEGIGFKGFEKTMLTSIFETQKPYFEVAKLVIGNIAKIEDIIARVMPLLGIPLVTQSLKPINNSGSGNRPKAIGYQGGKELKDALAKLQKLSKSGGKSVKINKDGTATREDIKPQTGGTQSASKDGKVSEGKSDNINWEVVSTVYSTGIFIPGLEYKYTYIDLPPESELPEEKSDLNLADDDPYNKYKPEKIILGIFKSDGTPLDPMEKIKTVSLNSNGQIVYLDTPFNRADWIVNSPKWQMDNIYPNKKFAVTANVPKVFPKIGSPIYKWEKGILTENSKTKPGDGWSIKKYGANKKSLLDNNIDAIEGSPMIVGFDTTEVNDYRNYFTDLVRFKMYQSEDLEQNEKNQYTNEIISKLNIQSHLENVSQYGQLKSSVYKPINGNPAFPDNIKFPFKPFMLYSSVAESDVKIAAYNKSQGKPPGYIWIDPESDYEFKVVRVDPTTNVEFQEAQGEPKFKSEIKSFIKNKLSISLSNNLPLGIEITKNNGTPEIFEDVSSYVLDNWNYNPDVTLSPQQRIQNNNQYKVSIWSKNPIRTYDKITSNVRIHNDLSQVDINNILSSALIDFNVYDLEYSNNKRYYRRYKYIINNDPLILTKLLKINISGNLKSFFEVFEKNNNSIISNTFKAKVFFKNNVQDLDLNYLYNSINRAISYANYGLIDINDKRRLKFNYNGNNYDFNLRIDELIKKVVSIIPSTHPLYTSLLIYISNFEYKFVLNLKDIFNKKVSNPLEDGVILMNDSFGTKIYLKNEEIVRWYYVNNVSLSNSNNTSISTNITQFSLPPFGKEYRIVINHDSDPDIISKNLQISRQEVDIPQYNIKVSNDSFPYGKVIDPTRLANQVLSTNELYSKGKYGHGSSEDPQEIEVIKRYMLTDLDTESYYIVEGILTDKNEQTGATASAGSSGSASGSGFYKLPHAIGAIKVFLSLLVDIVSKLIPLMTKLISLFKNPASFVTEIIKEKMGEGFSIFSKDSFKAFETAKRESDKIKNEKPSEKERKIRDIFKNSPLTNHVFVNNKGDYKFLLDGLAMLPFSIFGAQIPFGMELNFDKIPNSPINLILKKDLPKAKVKNIQNFLKPSLKDFKGPGSDGLSSGLNLSDLKSFKNEPLYKKSKNPIEYNNPNEFEVLDVKYSTGTFINGIDYNFIYINQDTENILKDAQNILDKNDEEITLDEAQKSVEDLNDALKKDPNNKAIKDMLVNLKNKIRGLNDGTQPLLKMLLGFVTLPIKIIGGIIEWLMDFFKSLANPLTLPSKIVELLSFSWIMKFFTPLGILELAGIKFEPKKILEWCALVNVPNITPPNNTPKIPDGVNLPELKYYKDAAPKGRHLIPDDLEIVDWNQILSMPFMPKLPVYSARMHREMCGRSVKVVMPTLCLIEKVINGIIDFIWSTLGIEALIPPPHIKLCSNSQDPDVADLVKIADDLQKDSGLTSSIPAGKLPNDLPGDAGFLYDITLDDGTVIKDLNYEEMQKYVKNNEDIGFDFQF